MSSFIEKFLDTVPLKPAPIITQISSSAAQNPIELWSQYRRIILPAFVLLTGFSLLWYLPIYDSFSTANIASYDALSGPPAWLIATTSDYQSLQRRAIIRATWQAMYLNQSTAEFKFILGNPEPLWEPVIQHENNTYGDLIVLKNLNETLEDANRNKVIEFFTQLVEEEKRWSFITRLHDDSYLDAGNFYKKWLEPKFARLNKTAPMLRPGIPQIADVLLGMAVKPVDSNLVYPSSQFYTMSWNLIEEVVDSQRKHNITDLQDGNLVAELLQRVEHPYKLVDLPKEQAFEMSFTDTMEIGGQRSAWAKQDTKMNVWFHPIGPGSLSAHLLKTDDDFFSVAECFGPDGARRPRAHVPQGNLDHGFGA